MIPILWRYLMTYFLKITLTCVLAFIFILLTMRLDEVAHFAALGAPLYYLLFFTLYQIPYILPVALPLSCLIAALILIQRLSNTHELTALRASGFAIRNILTPILLIGAFLSMANLWIASELATQSHLQTNLLKSELRSINPLLFLQNKHLMRLKGFYFETLGSSHVGESASDAILAIANKQQQRIQLVIAKQLKTNPLLFTGEQVTCIIAAPGDQSQDFDDLLIENTRQLSTHVDDFSQFLKKKGWTIDNDYLQMSFLLQRIKEFRQLLQTTQEVNAIKSLKIQLNRSRSEIVKRFSIASAVFTFTLMGGAFGINISRRHHYYTLYLAIALTTLFLVSFFIAKGMDHRFWLATTLYLTPHLLMILASLAILYRAARGIE